MIGRTLQELAVGDFVEITRVAWPDEVTHFLAAIGDDNPVHADAAFAAGTPFERPIVPGMWTAGLISAALGTRLPGPGSIYVKQDLKFIRPVYFGDSITARVEVVELVPERNRARLATTCRNADGETVLAGEAWVLPPLEPVRYESVPSATTAPSFWALAPAAWAGRATALWCAAVADGLGTLAQAAADRDPARHPVTTP